MDVWEASTRDGSAARVVAFDGVASCGSPLLEESAVTLAGGPGAYKVVELSLLDVDLDERRRAPAARHLAPAEGARAAGRGGPKSQTRVPSWS
jgi:hypothetical protein